MTSQTMQCAAHTPSVASLSEMLKTDNTALWEVTPFSSIDKYQRFGESCSLRLLEIKEERERERERELGGHKKPTSVSSIELTQGLSSAH
jgi:hypothetical protein